MNRSLVILAALCSSLCGSWACQPAPPPRQEPRQEIVIATGSDISGVNELVPSTRLSQEIRAQLFHRLLVEQPTGAAGRPQFLPGLAKSWTFSPDHRELTFTLRDDIAWSDGQPVTAEDVRWTWLAWTSPELAFSSAYIKERIVDVVVDGPHSVRVIFDAPYRTQLLDANEGFVLPRRQWQQIPFAKWREDLRAFERDLVVSGPFTLASWTPQQEVVLVPNRGSATPAKLDRVTFRLLPDQSSHVRQLRAGTVDVVLFVPPAEAAALDADPAFQLHAFPAGQYTYVGWNHNRPQLADAATRRALTQAIDRTALVETLWFGRAKVGVGPIPAESWAHHPELDPWPYDPEAARTALAAAGWADSDGDGTLDRNGLPLRLELLTNTGNATRRDAAAMIQAQLARVGVAIVPREVELNAMVAMNESGDYDAVIGAWGIDTSLDLRYAFHTAEIETGSNFVRYRNPEVDRLLDELRESLDDTATHTLLLRLQEILHQDQPYTFLWEPQTLMAARANIHGLAPSSLGALRNLGEWRIEEP